MVMVTGNKMRNAKSVTTSLRCCLVLLWLFRYSNEEGGVHGWSVPVKEHLQPQEPGIVSRRVALSSLLGAVAVGGSVPSSTAIAAVEKGGSIFPSGTTPVEYRFETRDRKNNKDAVIREDYWYMTGRLPPRKLEAPLQGDDPQWNAFGSCETSSSGENSCTYVSLKQRIPAYGKYASSIAYGASEYAKLGATLQACRSHPEKDILWQEAASYVEAPEPKAMPPAILDAEVKMVLFATAMMTSPNFPKPSRQLLVARFYANEARFSAKEIVSAVNARDIDRATAAWEFGRDSWNSFFQVINPTIVAKVGDRFQDIA